MWLAVLDDTPVGMIYVDMPQDAGWIERFATARPFAYIDHLGVRPDVRGSGAGSALTAFAHDLLDVRAWRRRCCTTLAQPALDAVLVLERLSAAVDDRGSRRPALRIFSRRVSVTRTA